MPVANLVLCHHQKRCSVERTKLSDQELLARDGSLMRGAESVLADLSLLERLSVIGLPIRIGSSAAGVMVLPDIDIDVLCPELDSMRIMSTLQPLFDHPNVKRMNFLDERGSLQSMAGLENEGIYCGIRYLSDGTLDGKTWTIDVWFFPENAPRPEFAIRDRLLVASPEERLAILRLKEYLLVAGRYGGDVHGIDVYRAVLDHGVRTTCDFKEHAS